MAVARVVELSASSETSFEDAIQQGIDSVGKEYKQDVASAWVKEQRVEIKGGRIANYQVNLLLTLVVGEGKPAIW